MKKIVTTHMFGLVYYAAPVWLSELTSSKSWKILESIHYKALRILVNDYQNTWSRATLYAVLDRAQPRQWMEYCNSKTAIQLMTMEKGPPLATKLISQRYSNDRLPMKTKMFNIAKKEIGRNSLANRLSFFHKINFDWRNGISKDALRINLKKTFIKT